MSAESTGPGSIRFGPFDLSRETQELLKHGQPVKLSGQAIQVLLVLTNCPGKLVTREELQQKLWPGDSFGDFEHGLNAAVNKLREKLGDSATTPLYVETLPGRGYRFIMPVESSEMGLKPSAPVSLTDRISSAPLHQNERDPFPRSGPWIKLFSAALAFAVVMVVIVRWKNIGHPPQPRILRYTQLTNDGAAKNSPSLVTDGSRIYFSENARGRFMIPVQMSVSGGEVIPIRSPFEDVGITDISPDRSELLVRTWFARDSTIETPLWVLPVPGGSPRRLGDLVGHAARWTLDGRHLLYAIGRELYIAKADGSESRKFVSLSGIPWVPRWSPDGKVLRFTIAGVLWEVSADGSNPHPLFNGQHDTQFECCGNWTPDGKYFVYQSTRDGATNIWAVRERTSLFHKTEPKPLPLTAGPLQFSAPSPSTDGKRLFVIGEQDRGELTRYDLASGRLVSYLSGISAEGLDFSPDAEWVVYVTLPQGVLWRSRLDGSQQLQLTREPMQVGLPRWSPDGTRIAFVGQLPGKPWKMYIVGAEGGSPEQLLPGGPENEMDPSWSPDGNSLAFGNLSAKVPVIHLLDLKTYKVSTIPGSEGLFSPRWSREGRYIAALTPFTHASPQQKIMLFDFTTQKWQLLVDKWAEQYGYPTWSRDGKYLCFANAIADHASFYRVRIADHKLDELANLTVPRGFTEGQFGWWTGSAPDGSPLFVRDTSIQEIYALDWELP